MYRQTELALTKTVIAVFVLIYLPWYFLIKYELYLDFRYWLLNWTILVLLFAIYKYMLWLVNVYVITNKRLICFEYKTLFQKTVTEAPADRILSVSFKTTGFFSSMLNFGDVEIQASGLNQPLVLAKVRDPEKVKDYIWQIHRQSGSV